MAERRRCPVQRIHYASVLEGEALSDGRDLVSQGCFLFDQNTGTPYYDWNDHCPSATGASVAFREDGRIVGIHKYLFFYGTLFSRETFVWKAYRDQGIALNLWGISIVETQCWRARVAAVTDLGFTLCASLRKTFPDIEFKIMDGGERTLRVLKKGKGRAA
jgi:hypothetical protein